MIDVVARARAVVEAMDRADVPTLQALLPQRHWDWLDSYLSDPWGWNAVDQLAGPDGRHRAFAVRRDGPVDPRR